MDEQIKKYIAEIITRIVNAASPEQVILFGSYSRGETSADSDVDLLVVESEPFGKQRSRMAEIGRLERAIGNIPVPTDILVYSRDEVERLRHAMNHVVCRVFKEGKVVSARP
jgi:predicted nucleotidyltransferase